MQRLAINQSSNDIALPTGAASYHVVEIPEYRSIGAQGRSGAISVTNWSGVQKRIKSQDGKQIVRSVKSALPISLWLTLLQFGIRAASAHSSSRNDLEFRPSTRRMAGEPGLHSHNRIGHEQAAAVASKDVLDQSVLKPFFACRLFEVRTSCRRISLMAMTGSQEPLVNG
jgi:hypothetical protein